VFEPTFSLRVRIFYAEDPGGWQQLLDVTRAADRAGVDRVALSGEHVVFGEHLENYRRPELGGRADGEQPTNPDGHFMEPITTIAHLTALTTRTRFTNTILLAALRRPMVLAKMAATIDVLSNGRLDLWVGVGWQREEYGAAGLAFDQRGRLLDQTLEVCQLLWRERRASYSSPDLSFEGIHMMPKPVQPGGVPIWVSGMVQRRAMRRLARYGAGWIPWSTDDNNIFESIPRMRDAVASLGRDPSTVQVAGKLPVVAGRDGEPAIDPSMERVPELLDAGVTDIRALLPVPNDLSAAEDYLTPWVEAFREVAKR
jgi:probable F420-dependent oxidoreductase